MSEEVGLYWVICDNSECVDVGIEREVLFAHLGSELYTGTNVRCDCGQITRRVDETP